MSYRDTAHELAEQYERWEDVPDKARKVLALEVLVETQSILEPFADEDGSEVFARMLQLASEANPPLYQIGRLFCDQCFTDTRVKLAYEFERMGVETDRELEAAIGGYDEEYV